MKPFSANKRISYAKARNAALLNQFATPGLGSLIAGRWLAGLSQLGAAAAGFVLIMFWFVEEMRQFYGQINGDVPVEPIGRILGWGALLFVLSWLWSLVTSIELLRSASRASADSLKLFGASLVRLDDAKIVSGLATIPNWTRQDLAITRTFEFKNFPGAMKFVNAVAGLAEQIQHHPDIDIRWNKITLTLTTHDAGGLTEKDFALARECDALLPR